MLFIVDHPIVLLVGSLCLLWLSAQSGIRIRERRHPGPLEDGEDFGLIVGATLTLVGLLIGFTFSLAAGRYDQRKNYEEEEANAIGTEYVRADLLPAADATNVRARLREYLDLRVAYYSRLSSEELRQNDAATGALQARLWSAVVPVANAEPNAVHTLVVSGMNDVLNSQGYTQAAWLNRVPDAAWILMIAIAVVSNILVGYRARGPERLMFLILPVALSIAFFLIADLDSPLGGIIRVHPHNLEILAGSLSPH